MLGLFSIYFQEYVTLKKVPVFIPNQQCEFLATFLAIAYYETPGFEVGLFLPQS